jgi:biopolymer transport protein ExbD/biopolymer transport protein TolR
VVSVTRSGDLFLNENPVNINELGAAVRAQFGDAKGVYVRADRLTVWDPIAQVVAALGQSGLEVRMVTQPEDDTRQRR